MQQLEYILPSIAPLSVTGSTDVPISGLCIDSREVVSGSMFIAIAGTSVDGHQYIAKAIDAGAVVIVCEHMPTAVHPSVTYLKVVDSALAAGRAAAAFYGHPAEHMSVVGVTGTNGKTTTATLLYQLFTKLGHKCGLISTVRNHIGDSIVPATHTTPDAVALQRMLQAMLQAGCTHVFMEVSSHAIHQQRIAGIPFVGAIFTNITHDHLDYHKTFDEYIRVKKMFFDGLSPRAFALTNIDDRRGLVMLQNTAAKRLTYGLQAPADIKGKVIENNLTGLVMYVNGAEAHFRMIGTFNAYNLLAVYGAAVQLGKESLEVLALLTGLHGAPGRFETFLSPEKKVLAIVDYAHSPDALLNVLATVNQLRTSGQQLITVVGCGGDRDKAKRPIMAKVACTHSNKVIFTADNPRSEDPEAILDEMIAGLTASQQRNCLRIVSRGEAIKTACMLAGDGDVIVIAGKGHEVTQEIKGVKHHFDDREQVVNTYSFLNI